MKPIGVQLYSLRDMAANDFPKVLKTVADIGYRYVEPAGFWNIRPSEFRKIIDDLGLDMISSHTPWAHTWQNLGEVMETASTLKLDKVVCGYGPDAFKDMDAIKKTAENTSKMQEILARNGFTLFQHNHYWEFERLNGKLKYEIYRELCPNVKYQIDCFWSTNKGQEDPVAILKTFADKTILLHMKDGVCKQEAANRGMVNGLLDMKIDLLPLGQGTLPIRDIAANTPEQVQAIIVELDFCSVEMVRALRESYEFMTKNGLAEGRK